ncbi:dihydrodipicolinate synthase family protein [Rhodopirellula sp. MGV]|uniref:dihydrodipicolinate synthase family protein n=1 Tax=Rhodopirellula sp. MGV TaxID=2023130 RepID=UPI000B96796C|nr:dihydrodipicolinate synthase family protein [Rhodopirellula sp. MGV]OYP36756.1 dihydrodipicolinate synthase family protein [Rhodopirellula sp. MGV]PNY34435.1 dihydrodipicolinate synthase family protein [Rhodopirellula baltica]
MTQNVKSIRGIVPPLVTPLSDRDVLDHDGLQRLLDHVIAGGVAGVFILGTTGEAPSLSYRLRREMISRTVEIVAGRVPVLVGVTDTAFVETVALAGYAAQVGADAAVLTTPYYFPAGQTELTRYVQNIAPLIPLPLMLYNMPGLTKVWFEIETLRTLSEIDSIIGVKDSSGDLEYFAEVCKLKSIRPDWSVLIGPEIMLREAVELGGDGGVNGGANVMPTTFVDWFKAIVSGDQAAAAKGFEAVREFQRIYDIGKYASRHIKATKSALSLIGICDDLPADPFNRFLDPERKRVAEILGGIGITLSDQHRQTAEVD